MMFNCHCRDCQRASGGPYGAVVYVPARAFKITKGEPRYYSTSSEAVGHNKRGFCAECGSRLFGGATDEGQGILASSLDEPSWFHHGRSQHIPMKRLVVCCDGTWQMDIFTSDAQPWDQMDAKLPKFEKYAP